MESIVRIRAFGIAAVLATAVVLSVVTSALVASSAYLKKDEEGRREGRTLNVTGSAKVRITSDLALWSIGVSGEGKTLKDAFDKLEGSVEKVRAFLSEKGFAEKTVKLSPIRTRTYYARDAKGKETRKVDAYRLLRRFDVRTSEVNKVAKAAGEVTELLRAGVEVESCVPEYIYTKLSDLKIKVQGEATANARSRAERIASESGCRIGAVREARAGILQITRPYSTEVSSSGVYSTSSIEKDVGTTVRLTLMIEPESALN